LVVLKVKRAGILWALVFAMLLAGVLNVGCAMAAEAADQKIVDLGMIAMAAGIAIGIAGFGAGIGLGMGVSSIAAAGAERPEIIGRLFIYVVFIEAIAIYALIVSIFIVIMLPAA